jgi:hypothetical protein
MANTALSRRVEKVVAYPPLSEMSDIQRCEFHEALLDADTFEDLAAKWQAAILKAERTGPTCGSSAAVSSRIGARLPAPLPPTTGVGSHGRGHPTEQSEDSVDEEGRGSGSKSR